MNFRYQAERFDAARRILMLPHPHGEAQSIASAFIECSLGLMDLQTEDLGEGVRDWLGILRDLMDTSDIPETSAYELFELKARQLTEAQKIELSQIIDELASWFFCRFWSNA